MTRPAGWCGIVEGEPGIFPAPITSGLVRLNRWVRRHLGSSSAEDESERDDPGTPPPAVGSQPEQRDI